MFSDIYRNKKIIITGNTGFKGSWLTTWLLSCGAKVYGYSIDVPTNPSMFVELNLQDKIEEQKFADIRDKETFADFVNKIKPDFIFHLAAQAIVSTSYKNPFDTITTNVVGMASVLEVLKSVDWNLTAVLITSDKAYDNVEWIWGYRENDALGGKDVYSGSKGAAELVVKSYWHSFIKNNSFVKLGVARAGNVIGGGDWSKDRIVVDTITSFSKNQPVEIRSPKATRPWQHVLEPLSGYLRLGEMLALGKINNGEAFNFGPRAEQTKTVFQLVSDIAKNWGINKDSAVVISGQIPFEEAKLLKLNCDKALAYLNWHSTLCYDTTVRFITDWYKNYYCNNADDLYGITVSQIKEYVQEAKNQNLLWSL